MLFGIFGMDRNEHSSDSIDQMLQINFVKTKQWGHVQQAGVKITFMCKPILLVYFGSLRLYGANFTIECLILNHDPST